MSRLIHSDLPVPDAINTFGVTHEKYMREALDLARERKGFTSPNPCVGAVIVSDGMIVGQGSHEKAGAPHAEVLALGDAGELAKGATIYITLEPCNHRGKTPPCTKAIINGGIKRVVYAVKDPNPSVSGGGGEALRGAGLRVIEGILESEARALNLDYFYFLRHKKPWIILKYAATLDGRVASSAGNSKWITGPEARIRVHQLRHEVDGILVGVETVIRDNPQLTARRNGFDSRQPVRIVLDSTGRTPLNAKVLANTNGSQPIIATTNRIDERKRRDFESKGVRVIRLPEDATGRPRLNDLIEYLGQQQMMSLLVEGGPEVAGSFVDEGKVNEVWAFLSPSILGGRGAKAAIEGEGIGRLENRLWLQSRILESHGQDILIRGLVSQESINHNS